MDQFFQVKNITEESADMYIVGEIKTESYWWDGESTEAVLVEFLDRLKELKDVKTLNLHINSPGGELFAGTNMYNALKRHNAHKVVYVDGMAASAASIVALAGDEIIIPKNAFLMIHKPSVMAWGNSNDLKKTIETLDIIEEGMISVYENNLIDKQKIGEVKEMIEAETWLNGEKASQYFTNIKVSETVDIAACKDFNLEKYKNAPLDLKSLVPVTPPPVVTPQPKPEPSPSIDDVHIDNKKKELEIYMKRTALNVFLNK